MNRPWGWTAAPWAKWDRAEQEREDEWEAAVQAESAGSTWTLRDWYASAGIDRG